jgi:hypothetical protein
VQAPSSFDGDASSSQGLDPYADTLVTYNIAANGRGITQPRAIRLRRSYT